MKIKNSGSSKRISRELFSWFRKKKRSKWFYVFGGLAFAIILSATHIFSIYYGATLQSEGKIHFVKRWGQTIVKKPLSIATNYFKSIDAQPERIQIDIKFENFQKIAFQRELALKHGPSYRVHPENPGYVAAKLTYKGERHKIKMKLKGGQIEHFGHEKKWSFKIKMKGDGKIEGMKYFSIQQAKNRGYLNEWVLHQFLKYNGLIGLKYMFFDLTVNGTAYGIYALEENMGKQLIESNGLKEGPILNYNSDLLWDDTKGQADYFYGGDIKAYNDNVLSESPALMKHFNSAKNLLELFRREEIKPAKVFDIEKLARFFAILDLTGYHHAASLNNMKFYYNPIVGLIEPIGYDNGNFVKLPGERIFGISSQLKLQDDSTAANTGTYKHHWFRLLFSDSEFFEQYVKELDRLTDEKLLDDFFLEIHDDFERNLQSLHTDYPWYNHDGEFEDPQTLYYNQKYIKSFLKPKKVLQTYFVGLEEKERKMSLEVNNVFGFPIKITDLTVRETNFGKPSKGQIIQSTTGGIIESTEVLFELPDGFSWHDSLLQETKVHFHVLGLPDAIQTDELIMGPVYNADFLKTDLMRQLPNASQFEFLETDEVAKTITIKSGIWNVEENVIFPEGYKVIARGGIGLNLLNRSKLLSFSALDWQATEEEPIIIESTDSTGQGVIVMQADEKSILDHVRFNNMSNPKTDTWFLTGAVTFYESRVDLNNIIFANNLEGDDYLNIVRTNFTINNSTFINTLSDAFDADFCRGSISNSTFINSGNDAIDVSGTLINIKNLKVDRVGDKALSAGEASKMLADNVEILNAEIGVTAKDNSSFSGQNINIKDTRVAYTVFLKKPEYGPARIEVLNSSNKDIEVPFLIEKLSYISFNNQRMDGDKEKVESLLYGAEFGKKSTK